MLSDAENFLRQPVMKVKKEPILDDEELLDALTWEGINHRYPIPVSRNIAEYTFSREYIANLYGGNIQQVFPRSKQDKLDVHCLDDWFFIRLDYNPHAPARPGRSGLYLCSDNGIDFLPTPRRTFIRFSDSHWMYMGQYRVKPRGVLASSRWTELKPRVSTCCQCTWRVTSPYTCT